MFHHKEQALEPFCTKCLSSGSLISTGLSELAKFWFIAIKRLIGGKVRHVFNEVESEKLKNFFGIVEYWHVLSCIF